MGENYLREQVENAKKRRDRARTDLDRPKWFDRPDLVDVVYNATPVDGQEFQEGEELIAKLSERGSHIDLVRCNRKVGVVEGDGATKLHVELSKPENGGTAQMRITNVSSLSKGADGKLIQG